MQMATWERMALEALLDGLYDAAGTLAALLASSSGEADTERVKALIRHDNEVWRRIAAASIAEGGLMPPSESFVVPEAQAVAADAEADGLL